MSETNTNVVPILSSSPPPDESFVDASEDSSSNGAKKFYADDSLLNSSKATNDDNSAINLENDIQADSTEAQIQIEKKTCESANNSIAKTENQSTYHQNDIEPVFEADFNTFPINPNENGSEDQTSKDNINQIEDIPIDLNAQFCANVSETCELKTDLNKISNEVKENDAQVATVFSENIQKEPQKDKTEETIDEFADFDTAVSKINDSTQKPDEFTVKQNEVQLSDANFGFQTDSANDEWNAFADQSNNDATSGDDWANFESAAFEQAAVSSPPPFDAFSEETKEKISTENNDKNDENDDDFEWSTSVSSSTATPSIPQPQFQLKPPPPAPKIQLAPPPIAKEQPETETKKELMSLEEFNAMYSQRADDLMGEVLAQLDEFNVKVDDDNDVRYDSSEPYFDEETQKIYDSLFDFQNSECLKFTWKGSQLEAMLIEALGMVKPTNLDKEQFFFDDYETSDVLEPVKVNTLAVKSNNESIQKSHSAAELSKMKNDASSASLNLNIDVSFFEEAKCSQQTSGKAIPKSSTILLNQLLDEIYPSEVAKEESQQPGSSSISATSFSATSEIDDKLNELIDQLPNLSFMNSKSLMFPVNTENEIGNSESVN